MKCRSFLYVNGEDPRLFVYKHPKWKWLGVTLNFAHGKRCVLVILFSTVPLLVILLLTHHHLRAALVIVWLVAFVWFCFRGAALDLERHPGNPAAR